MTQLQHAASATRTIAETCATFDHMVKGGLTAEQLSQLIQKRPALWGRFAHWLSQLPAA